LGGEEKQVLALVKAGGNSTGQNTKLRLPEVAGRGGLRMWIPLWDLVLGYGDPQMSGWCPVLV